MRSWALSLLLLAACDASGIHALGRRRDALVPCDGETSTWLRSTDEGTEILLLGRANPGEPVEAACFGHGFIRHDSSTRFEFGSYTLDADGEGEAIHGLAYEFTYQPERSVLDRDGSRRTDYPTPVSRRFSIVTEGAQLVVTLDETTMRMSALADVVAKVDVRTQAGGEAIFRLFNLPLLTSQVRLLGFGSGAMTQYVDANAEFGGLIRNSFTVNVDSFLDPNTLILYHQLEDLTGVVVDGAQRSDVDTHGNGHMDGSLSYLMFGSGGVTLRGRIDYSDLKIGNGVAAGGSYSLAVDGAAQPYVISYELATDVDLRPVLPVE
jgi:hypothetical protein